MLYNYLGNTGLKVSRLGFGAWVTFGIQVNESLAYDLMKVLKSYLIVNRLLQRMVLTILIMLKLTIMDQLKKLWVEC